MSEQDYLRMCQANHDEASIHYHNERNGGDNDTRGRVDASSGHVLGAYRVLSVGGDRQKTGQGA